MHKILLEEDARPVRQQQQRVNPTLLDVVKKEVIKLLAAEIICPISDSQWVSLVQVVPKKFGITVIKNLQDEMVSARIQNSWRVCIDYRKLSQATRKDYFLLSFVNQVLEKLVGYMQIHIAPVDQHKTTFTCPFGIAPSTFQRCIINIFLDLLEECMEIFIDDFTIYAESFKAYLDNLSKVSFWDTLSQLEVSKAKIDGISSLTNPTREVRSFLGHADFSKIALPLSKLLQKDTNFIFDQPYVDTFQELNRRLMSAPILQAPNWELPFELMCDASNTMLGAILGQRVGKQSHVIAYASRTMD
ncbi:Retrovirus-related Pol polyprotein, partial [Mucuna pruriens]